jgi:hypothetical protein
MIPAFKFLYHFRSIHAKMKVLETAYGQKLAALDLLAASERRQLDASFRQRGFLKQNASAKGRDSSRNNSLNSNQLSRHSQQEIMLQQNYKVEDDDSLRRLLQLMTVVEFPSIEQWNVKPDENLDHGKTNEIVFHM